MKHTGYAHIYCVKPNLHYDVSHFAASKPLMSFQVLVVIPVLLFFTATVQIDCRLWKLSASGFFYEFEQAY